MSFSSTSVTIFAIVAFVLCSSAAGDFCEDAYNKCKFRIGFATRIQTFKLDAKADKSFTRRLRSKRYGRLIGVTNTGSMSAEFLFAKKAFPVIEFGTPPYSPNHFKPLMFRRTLGSGIAHEKFRGNQLRFARGRCVRVHFSSYQLLGLKGFKQNFNNLPKDNTNCVVFRTK